MRRQRLTPANVNGAVKADGPIRGNEGAVEEILMALKASVVGQNEAGRYPMALRTVDPLPPTALQRMDPSLA